MFQIRSGGDVVYSSPIPEDCLSFVGLASPLWDHRVLRPKGLLYEWRMEEADGTLLLSSWEAWRTTWQDYLPLRRELLTGVGFLFYSRLLRNHPTSGTA